MDSPWYPLSEKKEEKIEIAKRSHMFGVYQVLLKGNQGIRPNQV